MVYGQRQLFSTFWAEHIQRAARAEMALRIRKAAVDADREALMRWHLQQVSQQPQLLPISSGRDLRNDTFMKCCCLDSNQGAKDGTEHTLRFTGLVAGRSCDVCDPDVICFELALPCIPLDVVQGRQRIQRTTEHPVVVGGDGMFWPQLYGSDKVPLHLSGLSESLLPAAVMCQVSSLKLRKGMPIRLASLL